MFEPCKNLSETPEFNFVIDAEKFIENKVIYVYHSHVNESANPSKFDTKSSEELCVPFLIYSLRDNDFKLYQNKSV